MKRRRSQGVYRHYLPVSIDGCYEPDSSRTKLFATGRGLANKLRIGLTLMLLQGSSGGKFGARQ
jgi:hypothetical protein